MRSVRWFVAVVLATFASTIAFAQDTRIPLRADSSAWLDLGGQVRLRAEGWNGFGFGTPAVTDDGFVLGRVLYHADLHLTRTVSVFAELKSSLATQRTLPGGRRPSDEDVFDLQQLYAETAVPIGASRLTVRAGRSELRLGRERLVSPLDWANTRRIFQGGSAVLGGPGFTLNAFWARPLTMRRRTPNISDSTRQLYGVYLARAWPRTRFSTELYWLRHEARAAAFNGTSGGERRHTLGQRASLSVPARGGLDGDLETAWQTGAVGASKVQAWMVAAQAGWTFPARRPLRVYLGLDAACGDDSTGGAVGTFNQMYPLGHAYLGYLDVHGRQNVVDLSAGASRPVTGTTSALLDVHRFWRARAADALYGVDGSVARQPGVGLSRSVGTELDLTLRQSLFRRRLALQAGYSRYWRGRFIEQSGGSRNMDWVYLQSTLTF